MRASAGLAVAPAPNDGDEVRDVRFWARQVGDISGLLTPSQVASIGADAVRDYQCDLTDRMSWATRAEKALEAAAQTLPDEEVTFPFEGAADTHYPILTVAALQFQARAYPAIFKGDEVVSVKVVGKDRDGAKTKRASRVREYLNTIYGYRLKDWEADTDALLLQLPIVGCGFRKQWWDGARGFPASSFVPALRMVVPMSAKDLLTAPRYTEELPSVYPYQIRQRQRSGFYRADVVLPPETADDEAPRLLLEQHRLMDLDDDGLDEPYIVTLDKATSEVLRIEPAFAEEDLEVDAGGAVIGVTRRPYYTLYGFFPDPKGGFYPLGFGHFLSQISAIIDTTINQMLDAGQAAIAGGGFVAGGIRMQGAGQSNWLEWRPGEYKVVETSAGDLRSGIYERTFPQPSAIMFQLLDLMLGAARDIAAIKDVTSGDASNNGQVGTTLALIEQGLQVFTAIYKRIYRALRMEFQQTYGDISAYGGAQIEADYLKVLDDDEADFKADFDASDMDIRPVSDPGNVTRMQKMARAQFLFGLRGTGLNDMEIMRRVLEAADIEDADKLMPPEEREPDPMMVAELQKTSSETDKNAALAEKARAETAKIGAEIGLQLGEADEVGSSGQSANDVGRLEDMAGEPRDGMGNGRDLGQLGSPEEGMGSLVMGEGAG